MTGPEHYAEAERLEAEGCDVVAKIRAVDPEEMNGRARRDDLGKQAMGIWMQAQMHATLALAAAYAEVNPTSAWREVAGQEPATGGLS